MATPKTIDRVMIVTLQGDTADALTRALTAAGFQVTIVESRGGFLLEPSSTLMIGYSSAEQEILLGEHPRPVRHPQTAGARPARRLAAARAPADDRSRGRRRFGDRAAGGAVHPTLRGLRDETPHCRDPRHRR